jgi:MoxR-like ATPase
VADHWRLFHGDNIQRDDVSFPKPPPWRDLQKTAEHRGETYIATPEAIDAVNAALHLRRPLLVEGPPGVGKSSLAYKVARELRLGNVRHWPINSRSTLREGLYQYDAMGRMHHLSRKQPEGNAAINAAVENDAIERFITLKALGTSLIPAEKPMVVLIDEIDKSDIDLPNDLLHVLENGSYHIPELERIRKERSEVEILIDPGEGAEDQVTATIRNGLVQATCFPFIVITTNGERELPPAFLRRCIRHSIKMPERARLEEIVRAHLGTASATAEATSLIEEFLKLFEQGNAVAVDQLLNAVFVATSLPKPSEEQWRRVKSLMLNPLNE